MYIEMYLPTFISEFELKQVVFYSNILITS